MPTDEQIFALRDDEKRRKKEEREKLKNQHVWEKGTWATKGSTARVQAEREEGAPDDDETAAKAKSKASLVAAATKALGNDRRKEKENMAEFIAKKREMFLVQMSLDTKRAEIRKLEERALQREEALKRSEQMLEEDAQRFDAFLKENDMKAVEAIKKAESETKAKADKVQEIKKLNAQIAAIKSEMSKYEEQLEDCRKYKEFLDKLTPPEWIKEQTELKQKRRAERAARRLAEAQEAEAARAAEAAKAAAAAAPPGPSGRPGANQGPGTAGGQKPGQPTPPAPAAAVAAAAALPAKPATPQGGRPGTSDAAGEAGSAGAASAGEEESDEELPMHFELPGQLLDIFTALEESNLFLIQNSQETEEALEELKAKYRDTKSKMDSETATLQKQIDQLKTSIRSEEEKAAQLQEKARASTVQGAGSREQERLLGDLNSKISDVYVKCGFDNDGQMQLSALQMLTNIEQRLEDYLSQISEMPREYVELAEKQKEKERRQRVREEKLEQQKKQQEDRIARALERSKAPATKKTGKPVMFRSAPVERRRRDREAEGKKKDDEEDDYMEFFQ